jgi:DinB superfamily
VVDAGPLLLESLDYVWARVRGRMDGMGDDEYLWEPVPGCWSVRPAGDGRFVADVERPPPEPGPVTTIAWRTGHIAVACLESYTEGAFGTRGLDLAEMEWVGTAAEALAGLDAAWAAFRGAFGTLDADGWARPIGPAFGPFADDSFAALALHAHDEVVHHGAEVALLRDLWRYR